MYDQTHMSLCSIALCSCLSLCLLLLLFFNFIYWYYCFATTISVCESSFLDTGTFLVHIHILIIWWSSISTWCCSNRSNFEICSFIALHFLFFIMGMFLYLWVIFWADLDLTFCGCGLHLLFQNICWLVLLRKLLVYTCIFFREKRRQGKVTYTEMGLWSKFLKVIFDLS